MFCHHCVEYIKLDICAKFHDHLSKVTKQLESSTRKLHHSHSKNTGLEISLGCTAVNEFYQMIRIGVAVILEVTEQRPMNNEYANA